MTEEVAAPVPAPTAVPALENLSLQVADNKGFKIDALSREQLLQLHAQIEQKIGGLALGEVNLVRETLLQVQRAKALQEDANKFDSKVPMNQRAQVQNSLAGLLTQLGKIQTELYTSERVKRIQAAVIKVVKTLPKKQQDLFFELLENELDVAAAMTDVAPEGVL